MKMVDFVVRTDGPSHEEFADCRQESERRMSVSVEGTVRSDESA